MKRIFYLIMAFFSRRMGPWVFQVGARFVAAGYFIFFPSRVGVGVRFYKALFPEMPRLRRLWCTWRQFQRFTNIFVDRFLLTETGDISYTSKGWSLLTETLEKKSGAVLLMSHLGNWETAAHLLKREVRDVPVLLYMGARPKEQIEGMQKRDLSKSGIHVIAMDQDAGSPFDILHAVKVLKSGGVVSMAGDIVWNQAQKAAPVHFLGHEARLPEAPHVLALVSGAPLLVFFSFRTGPGRYRFEMHGPIRVTARDRSDRKAAMQRSAQAYADLMEKALRENPLDWGHFTPFLGDPREKKNNRGQNSLRC
ncbi:MAG: lysophospholipid acyltransferase family protein [Desulfobacterales bacterium]|nr:lysophospholipid acyltransferase family protein [Desulfobacterales bacterium]